jgi:hypothetical protein
MVDFRIDPVELRPLVEEIVTAVLGELEGRRQLLDGKLALTEPEAANLLGLHPWQLRDLRLAEKISYCRIVGGRVRYTFGDLEGYLRRNHVDGDNSSSKRT